MRPKEGDIVLVDWRDARPREPNKIRPAVVIEAPFFGEDYPNVILAPLSNDDPNLAFEEFSVRLDPNQSNGCTKVCWILGHSLAATSFSRIRRTRSTISYEQLSELRSKIARAIGITQS
jgi:mRNA interferase MazF